MMTVFTFGKGSLCLLISLGVLAGGMICRDGWGTEIHDAAWKNDKAKIEELLSQGVDINAEETVFFSTPLFFAVEAGNMELAEFLISKGANVNAKSKRNSIVGEAVNRGNLEMIELLLAHGAQTTPQECTALLTRAVTQGVSLKITELLIARGGDVNTVVESSKEDTYYSLLHLAVDKHHKPAAELLIDKGVDVNGRDSVDRTPLRLALGQRNYPGKREMVNMLLSKGATVDVFSAAMAENPEYLGKLLADNPALANARSPRGSPPLHFAAQADAKDAAELLITKGADVNAKNSSGASPLHTAAYYGSRATAELLIAKGADINMENNFGMPPLWKAIEALEEAHTKNVRDSSIPYVPPPQLKVVKLLIEKGVNPNTPCNSRDYRTKVMPLHVAVEDCESLDFADFLIAHGADINARNNYGESPLLRARYSGDKCWEMVNLLISKGANVNQAGFKGLTPLHVFIEKGEEYIELLIAKGADINAKDAQGRTPMDYAMEVGYGDIVAQVYRRHNLPVPDKIKPSATQLNNVIGTGEPSFDPGVTGYSSRDEERRLVKVKEMIAKQPTLPAMTDKEGRTPLHVAAQLRFRTIVDFLISKGADVNARIPRTGGTPLHEASFGGNCETVQLLIDRGADVNAKEHDDDTPLHVAANFDHADIVSCLISNKADINLKNKSGDTPLQKAIYRNSSRSEKILREHGAK